MKYRRKALTDSVGVTLKDVCFEIAQRYEMNFLEIGTDGDHVHFLIQTVPIVQPSTMVGVIKSISAKEIFQRHPDVKKMLWGGQFWTSGYYLNTVGQYGNEQVIAQYVRNQGKKYQQIHRGQLSLFNTTN